MGFKSAFKGLKLIFMDLCIVDDSVEIPTRCSFVLEFIISKFNVVGG
jgi:hypothetical protein